MAAATVTKTEFGYIVSGDTGEATVNTGRIRVKVMAFAGNADNATCTCTSFSAYGAVPTETSCVKFKTNGTDLDAPHGYIYFGEKGIPLTSLKVTLSHASDVLYIFVV